MKKTLLLPISAMIFTLLISSGCTTNYNSLGRPALRTSMNQQSQLELQQVIAKSLGASKVRLAKNAFTQTNSVIIERQMMLGRDLTTPTVFKLFNNNGQCILTNMRSKQRYLIVNTKCH